MNRAHASAALNRLVEVAPHLGLAKSTANTLASRGPGPLLDVLAREVQLDPSDRRIWLLLALLSGGLPTSPTVTAVRRALALTPPHMAYRSFLGATIANPDRFSFASVRIVTDAIVVDVDFSARSEHNTGVQRVARNVASRWSAKPNVVFTAWEDGGTAFRALTPTERTRALRWGEVSRRLGRARKRRKKEEVTPDLLVPLDSLIVVTEVPTQRASAALTAIAESGSNSVALIGYDVIPIVSAHTVPIAESNKFIEYLGLVKHSDRVAGISATAAEEFSGFVDAIRAQGLRGPVVVSVPLPVDVPGDIDPSPHAVVSIPGVLCVGSQEPRKNQLSVLGAAEELWQEGLTFSLTFVGGGSRRFTRVFDREVRFLARRGRDVRVLRGVEDASLAEFYRASLFSVFPSIHEGYGLPVAESLAYGRPVITTEYGSTAEIASGGGCLTINPRDLASLAAAMRQLLAEPSVLKRLRAEIEGRAFRTWDNYADDLWHELVEGRDA